MAWKHAQGLESLLLQWSAKVHTHTAHVYVCTAALAQAAIFLWNNDEKLKPSTGRNRHSAYMRKAMLRFHFV